MIRVEIFGSDERKFLPRLAESINSATYQWCGLSPSEWLHLPLPVRGNFGVGDGADPLHDVLLREHVTAQPSRIQTARHVAHLMYPPLERADPAEHEGAQHVVCAELLL